MALLRPRRWPVVGSVAAQSGPSWSNIRSLWVSGASSAVSYKNLFGNDNLAMVRHALPYCTRNDPVV